MTPTQVEIVERHLRAGWTCGTTLLEARIPRYSARIAEINEKLMAAGQFPVDRRRCQNETHVHDSVQYQWRIV